MSDKRSSETLPIEVTVNVHDKRGQSYEAPALVPRRAVLANCGCACGSEAGSGSGAGHVTE